MDLSLFFAGTAGSVPSARRGLPALLLRAGGDRVLFDCGEGTQQQLLRSIGLPELDAVFLTHFHLDHWLGLLGMVKTFDLRARERPLTLYGPPGLRALIEAMRPVIGRTAYPLRIVELEPHEEVRLGGYLIAAFPVEHRVTAYGYAFVEDDRPGRFDADAARALGVPEGPDFGRLQRGEVVAGVRPEQVVGPRRPGRRIVISGDTRPCQTTEVYAHGADVLVHEATFLEDERERARATAHATARQAAELARDAGVRMLAVTHLSTRYFPRDVRDEARAVFPGTVVPRDFDAIHVPFPERGEPALVKAEPEPEPEPAPAPAAP
jgi:ribonuclease Z